MKRKKMKVGLNKLTVANLSNLDKTGARGGSGYTDQNTCPIICQGTDGCDCGMSDSCAPGTSDHCIPKETYECVSIFNPIC